MKNQKNADMVTCGHCGGDFRPVGMMRGFGDEYYTKCTPAYHKQDGRECFGTRVIVPLPENIPSPDWKGNCND